MAGDRIARIAPALPDRALVEIDAGGRLVTPALVEPHLHLDAVLTEGEPRHNVSGSLFEGIQIGIAAGATPRSRPRRASSRA